MIVPWLEPNWQAWERRLSQARVPHALLVAGPAGLGKRALVEAMAASLLCTDRNAAHACGLCRSCLWLKAGTHPDFHAVQRTPNERGELRQEIGVDQVRDTCDRLVQTSQRGGYRVAVFDPADALTVNAANALLKTLEEPEPYTVMVLVSDQPERLPATIRSRCQRIDARPPTAVQARDWLLQQGIDTDAAGPALALAAGNPGLALQFSQPDQRKLSADTLAGLGALLERRVTGTDLAQQWGKEYAEVRLLYAALALRLLAWEQTGGLRQSTAGAVLEHWARSREPHALVHLIQQALQVRAQLKTPLRGDLLLLEWLQQVQDCASSTSHP